MLSAAENLPAAEPTIRFACWIECVPVPTAARADATGRYVKLMRRAPVLRVNTRTNACTVRLSSLFDANCLSSDEGRFLILLDGRWDWESVEADENRLEGAPL